MLIPPLSPLSIKAVRWTLVSPSAAFWKLEIGAA